MSFTIKRGKIAAENFTIISNALLRDADLSFKARGLAAWMLSHRADWELTLARIAEGNGIGVDAVRSAVKELESAGYLVRERQRDADTGQLGAAVYHLTDMPTPAADAIRQLADEKAAEEAESAGQSQSGVSQRRVSQGRENPPHKKTNSKKTISKNSDAPASAPDQSSEQGKDEQPETVNQRANRLATEHYEALGKMGHFIAMAKIIKKALEYEYEAFTDEQIRGALAYIRDRRWSLTGERLWNVLHGGPRPAGSTKPNMPTTAYTAPQMNGMVWE